MVSTRKLRIINSTEQKYKNIKSEQLKEISILNKSFIELQNKCSFYKDDAKLARHTLSEYSEALSEKKKELHNLKFKINNIINNDALINHQKVRLIEALLLEDSNILRR